MNQEEIVKLAAEAGAKAAIDTMRKENQRFSREIADRRLRNTKLLLKNYRLIKEHAANAVFSTEREEDPLKIMEDLMMPGRSPDAFVESIKRSAERTATIVRHIDTMLGLYRVWCFELGEPEDARRWRVIYGLYIAEQRQTISDLADAESVVERTIYKDVDTACERISALMFGIDGIKKK